METADRATLEQALANVSDALDRVAALPTMTAPNSDVLAALEAVPVLRNKLDALASKISRAAELSRAVNREGCRDAALWMGKHTGAAPKHARADVRAARWLVAFGEFAEAHETGVLSRDHIRLLRQADKPITHHKLVRDQAVLVETARTCSFAGFEIAVQYWINLADPDGDIPAEQVRTNAVSVARRSDGSVSFKGELDPLLGTAFNNALIAEFEKLDAADSEQPGPYPGRRSLRATALANLVAKGSTRADGTIPAPLINVVASQKVAEDLAEGLVPHLDPHDIDARCEFLDGTPLHPAFAAKLLPRAIFRRVIFGADSRPIDVSVNTRLFPRWMKDVALIQTRGNCTEPGCDAPFHWLQGDHRIPRSKGGPTSLDNLDPLCKPANLIKSDRLPPDKPPNTLELNARIRQRFTDLLAKPAA